MSRYPVYIPSKGRADKLFTAKMFANDGIDFRVVVEPQEAKRYADAVGQQRILTLPLNDRGLVFARNWIKDYSIAKGHDRHWQFDDDVPCMQRLYRGYRIRCSSRPALALAEDFADRYENVALLSFNSDHFMIMSKGTHRNYQPPFYLNHRCYTCFLVNNAFPNRWRYRYNEDTDMTLQALADGWCTILLNAFLIKTPRTMSYGGGQTPIYVNDGRLKMARELERVWPGTVTTSRRFKRPQHRVAGEWEKFDNQLRLKETIDLVTLPKIDERGLALREVEPLKSERLRRLLEEAQ